MVDHGADAATVVANAAIDTTKTLLNISAGAFKQLMLLMYEGSRLKSGETNLEKIIKALGEGDRVCDAKLSKAQAEKLPELAKKHDVAYAIVENAEGKLIVYYQESQSTRMKNILEDLKSLITDDEVKKSENIDENIIESDSDIELLQDMKHNPEETIVMFNSKKTDEYFETRHFIDEEHNNEIRSQIFFHSKDGVEIVGIDVVTEKIKQYENMRCFQVKGYYSDEKIRSYMAEFDKKYDEKQNQKDATKNEKIIKQESKIKEGEKMEIKEKEKIEISKEESEIVGENEPEGENKDANRKPFNEHLKDVEAIKATMIEKEKAIQQTTEKGVESITKEAMELGEAR